MGEWLRPYEKYKKTELDWLDSIPLHWNEQSIRSFTKLSTKKNNNCEILELLSVYRDYGVIKKSSRNDNHNVESQDLSNYKFVDKGYLVLNKMKVWQGSLGVSKYTGIVSPAYIVCKLIGNINFNFIHYLLRSSCYKTIYNRLSYGVRVGQWDMRYDDFKNIKVYLPPLPEQNQIVKYLDSVLAKIAKFIRAKKRLIELLKEQKQAVINEAVTKGLDPNAKMKPSGIKWLGDIPKEWEVRRLSEFAQIILSGLDKKSYSNQEQVKLCNYVDVYKNDYITNTLDFMWATATQNEIDRLKLLKGDIIITKDSESWDDIGVPALVCDDLENVLCGYHLAIIRNISNAACSEFLYNSYLSQYLAYQYKIRAKGVTRFSINYQHIHDTIIVLPPIQIQTEISIYIKNIICQTDATITATQKEIDLITEYRTRLISDVVTGKVDVRSITVDDVTEHTELEDIDEEIEENEIFPEDGE